MTHVAAFEASAELMCKPVLCAVRTTVAARYAWYFGSVIGVLLGGAPIAADVIAAVVIAAGVAGVSVELLDPHAETPMPAEQSPPTQHTACLPVAFALLGSPRRPLRPKRVSTIEPDQGS
jgi:hypothetical protein